MTADEIKDYTLEVYSTHLLFRAVLSTEGSAQFTLLWWLLSSLLDYTGTGHVYYHTSRLKLLSGIYCARIVSDTRMLRRNGRAEMHETEHKWEDEASARRFRKDQNKLHEVLTSRCIELY